MSKVTKITWQRRLRQSLKKVKPFKWVVTDESTRYQNERLRAENLNLNLGKQHLEFDNGNLQERIAELESKLNQSLQAEQGAVQRNAELEQALRDLRLSAQGQDDGWIIDAVDEALKENEDGSETD